VTKGERASPNTTEPLYPLISVVIPAFNEEALLPRCLASLQHQDYPGPYEIIVVDNGSSDGTSRLAQESGARVLREPLKGVARARQKGSLEAQGEIIAGTDADTVVPPHWLSSLWSYLANHPERVAVHGPYLIYGAPWWTRLLLWAWSYIQGAIAFVIPTTINIVGCNYAVRARSFRTIGGFNTELYRGEDLDLSLRLRSVGIVRFVPTLRVSSSGRYYSPSFLRRLSSNTGHAWSQIVRHHLREASPLMAPLVPQLPGHEWPAELYFP